MQHEHWVQKVSIAQKNEGAGTAGKAPAETGTEDVLDFEMENKSGDRILQLYSLEKMIDQVLVETKK